MRSANHGTYAGYNWHMEQRKKLDEAGVPLGKRHEVCPPCLAANTRQQDGYRKRVYLNGGNLNRPAAGTRRRLQALQAMGWNFREIGRKYGRDGSVLSNISCTRNKEMVYAATAEKIAMIYAEMHWLTPLDDWLHQRTLRQARERGYLPPLCWEEETIDDPYALPIKDAMFNNMQIYRWYMKAASDIERVEWVLRHGFPKVPRVRNR